MRAIALALLLAPAAVPVQAADCEPVPGSFRLYRSSVVVDEPIYLATFDSPHGHDYNAENCAISAQQFASKPGVAVRFWCEPVD